MGDRLIRNERGWVRETISNRDLYHHGRKGQKWGVRNGPPYPLNESKAVRSTKKSMLIEEEIRAGKISKAINKDKQLRHTEKEHLPGRSYLYGEVDYAQKLVNELGGTGELVLSRTGEWTRKEKVQTSYVIGAHVDESGNESDTNKAMIVYSKTGSHIYPRKE